MEATSNVPLRNDPSNDSTFNVSKADTQSQEKRRSLLRKRRLRHGPKPTARLATPIFLQPYLHSRIQIAANEKVNIMFSFKNKHCIYRRKDGTIAVVENASYQQDKPQILFDGDKHNQQLRDARVVLRYAVSKKYQKSADGKGVELQKSDVILVLAESSRYVVGINFDKKVGIFMFNLLRFLTEPRLCISDGMILSMYGADNFVSAGDMKSVEKGKLYQVAKASVDLFKWVDIADDCDISIHCLIEVTVLQDSWLPHNRPIRSVETADETYDEISGFIYGDTKLSQKQEEPLPQPHLEGDQTLHTDMSLESEPWFHGNLSRQQAAGLLRNDGDFLVRYKTGRSWEFVISFKHSGVAHHMELLLKDGSYKTHGGKFKSVRMVIHAHWDLGYSLSSEDKSIRLINPIYREDAINDTDDDDDDVFCAATTEEESFDLNVSDLDDWETSRDTTAKVQEETFEGSSARPKQRKQYVHVFGTEGNSSERDSLGITTEEENDYINVQQALKKEGDTEHKQSSHDPLPAEPEEGDTEYIQSFNDPLPAEREEGDTEYMQSYDDTPPVGREQEGDTEYMQSYDDTPPVGREQEGDTEYMQSYDDTPSVGREQEGDEEYMRYFPDAMEVEREEEELPRGSDTQGDAIKEQFSGRGSSIQQNRDSHQANILRKDTVRGMTKTLEAVGLGLPHDEELYDDTSVDQTYTHQGLSQSTERTKVDKQSKLPKQSFEDFNLPEQGFSRFIEGGISQNLTYKECFVDEKGGDIVMPMVRVSIPPKALSSGEIISITLFNDNTFGMNKCPRICPIVSLNPDGLQFKLPVEVSIAHCDVVDDRETSQAAVYFGTFNKDKDILWEELKCRCTVKDNFCHFTLDHFCFIDIQIGVRGKKIKVVPVAERMDSGEDLLMTCWILNSNSTQDIQEEIRNDVSPSAVLLDTFQEFVILQTNVERPLHCKVRSLNERWTPVTMEQLLPFTQVWHSSKASFKFRHEALFKMDDGQTSLDFTFEFKQPDNHEIIFNVRTKLDYILRSRENSAETPENEEDMLLFALAKRLDERDCMRIATYYNLSPEALDYIKGKQKIGVALFKELRKRNFYNGNSMNGLTNALRDINLSSFAFQIETIFPETVTEANINTEIPDDFGKLKVIISDQLMRDQCIKLAMLWDLTRSFKSTLSRDVAPGIALLYELERCGYFGKNNVGKVYYALVELNFNHLSDIIKSYRQTTNGVLTKVSFTTRHS